MTTERETPPCEGRMTAERPNKERANSIPSLFLKINLQFVYKIR
jgi:hypothetical protein